jgi:uncharacterized protein YjbJ (UPF0337 family)
MDREHVKGFAEEAKSAIKEGAEQAVAGSFRMKERPTRAKGSLHNVAGDVKAARDAMDD